MFTCIFKRVTHLTYKIINCIILIPRVIHKDISLFSHINLNFILHIKLFGLITFFENIISDYLLYLVLGTFKFSII